jgi:hypothetical protein
LLQQNTEFTTELNEFKELLAADGTREPGISKNDKLKKMATSLRQRNEILTHENYELGKIL